MVGGGDFVIALAEHEHDLIADGVLAGGGNEHEQQHHGFHSVLPDVHAGIAQEQRENFADEFFFAVECETSTRGGVVFKHGYEVAQGHLSVVLIEALLRVLDGLHEGGDYV